MTDVDESKFQQLLEPFPKESISKKPGYGCKACKESSRKVCDRHTWVPKCKECGQSHSSSVFHLDYVGHADVTRRLLEVDPLWDWEPLAYDTNGLPLISGDGMWIKLTVLGKTRLGFGDADGKPRNGAAVKEIIGDAIRNAALRFGVAVDLWSKSDAATARKEAEQVSDVATVRAPDLEDDAAREEAEKAAQQIADKLTRQAADDTLTQGIVGETANLATQQNVIHLTVTVAGADGKDAEMTLRDYLTDLWNATTVTHAEAS